MGPCVFDTRTHTQSHGQMQVKITHRTQAQVVSVPNTVHAHTNILSMQVPGFTFE